MKIENNICPNCGAAMVDDLSHINAWHCQYCGTTIDKMITSCGSDNRKKSPCDYCIDDSDCDNCDAIFQEKEGEQSE